MATVKRDKLTSALIASADVLKRVGVGYIPGVKPVFHMMLEIPWLLTRKKVWDIEGSKMYLNAHEGGIMGAIFRDYIRLEGKEQLTTNLFKQVVKEGNTVLDIGANVGYFTLLAAKLVGDKGEVFAFEPEPHNYNVIIKNIDLNNYPNIIAIPKAVSNVSGEAELYLSQSDVGAHTLRHQHNHPQFATPSDGQSVKVKTIMLDTMFRDIPVDVIKMDCEGSEMAVLLGAKEVINRNRNIKIFSEFFPSGLREMGYSPEAFLLKILEYGFNITIIDELRNPSYQVFKTNSVSEVMAFCDGDEKIVNLYLER